MKQIIIYMESDFDIKCGGLVVQYQLARILSKLNKNVSMITPRNIKNHICNKFSVDKNINIENTIVIYGETIKGNPLNAKYVIRWILAPLGICSPIDIYKTWSPNDLVYYFNSENKMISEQEKVGNIYKLLNIIYINPLARNLNKKRSGCCHTFRKSHFHKNLIKIHPSNSFELKTDLTQVELILYFNKYKYFISYDPLTFLSVIAALCGCISIVKKIEGISKQQWLNSLACSDFLKEMNITSLYGIAYGADDLDYAIKTLHLVKQQWNRIMSFMINKNIKLFLNDMDKYKELVNTVENNYY